METKASLCKVEHGRTKVLSPASDSDMIVVKGLYKNSESTGGHKNLRQLFFSIIYKKLHIPKCFVCILYLKK